jgi:hypothetical protein
VIELDALANCTRKLVSLGVHTLDTIRPAGIFNVNSNFPSREEGGSGTVWRERNETCSCVGHRRTSNLSRHHLYSGQFLFHLKRPCQSNGETH